MQEKIIKTLFKKIQLNNFFKRYGLITNFINSIHVMSQSVSFYLNNDDSNGEINSSQVEDFEDNINDFMLNLSEDKDLSSFYESFKKILKENLENSTEILEMLGVEEEFIPDNIEDLLQKVEDEELEFDEAFKGLIERLDKLEGVNQKLINVIKNDLLESVTDEIVKYFDDKRDAKIAVDLSKMKFEIANFGLSKKLNELVNIKEKFEEDYGDKLDPIFEKLEEILSENYLTMSGAIDYSNIDNSDVIQSLSEDIDVLLRRIKSELNGFNNSGNIASFNIPRNRVPEFINLYEHVINFVAENDMAVTDGFNESQ
ncbi:MAG: hypothetical protein ACOCQD_00460 [archaeon]